MVLSSSFHSSGHTFQDDSPSSCVSHFLYPPRDSLSVVLRLPCLSSPAPRAPSSHNLVGPMVLLPHNPWSSNQPRPSIDTDTCLDTKCPSRRGSKIQLSTPGPR